jgi:hypothetical protein
MGSSMQSSSTLGSTTPGFCTPAPPQEQTKGCNTTPSVPIDGAITTKITRIVVVRTTTATIRYTLHPKDASSLRWLAEPPEGITPFTVVELVRTPTTEEERRGH